MNEFDFLPDVYFDFEYCKLYEEIEHGTCEKFEYSDENGKVVNVFIKRPIPWLVSEKQYYDIITPYGYGGPVITKADDKDVLIRKYWEAWEAYCKEHGIVCEFVRFHPLLKNYIDFQELYNAQMNRNTLAIELTDDFFMTQFTAKCRNTIRRAEKLGVICEVDEQCESIETFCQLYYKTMEKDNADDYYFFSMEYFEKIREALKGRIFLVNAKLEDKTIAGALFMVSDNYLHYHLSATDPEYYSYSANNLILKVAADIGNKMGRQWLHLGGGVSSSEEDSLFRFKRTFAREERNLHEFWLGRAIYNQEVYDSLVNIRYEQGEMDEESTFFPRYRIPIGK